MALSLDGSAQSTSASVTLSTTKTNDVIVLLGITNSSSGTSISVSDTAGLAWKVRFLGSPASYCWFEAWAPSPGILTSDTITVAGAGIASSIVALTAFGVNGAYNIDAPFDSNAGLPFNGGNGEAVFSTTQADDLVFALYRTTGGSVASGWTAIGTSPYNGTSTVMYATFSTAQTNTSVPAPGGTTNLWIADAITASAPPTPVTGQRFLPCGMI